MSSYQEDAEQAKKPENQRRPLVQFRPIKPTGVSDGFWAPERDVALAGPNMVWQAIRWLQDAPKDTQFASYMAAHSISEEDLAEAALRFGEGFMRVIAPEAENPCSGLQAAGFYELSTEVQLAMWFKMGQVLFLSIYNGIRDTLSPGSVTPGNLQHIFDALEQTRRAFEAAKRAQTAGGELF